MGLLLVGCKPETTPPVIKPDSQPIQSPGNPVNTTDPRLAIEQEVVATVNGHNITMKQLMEPLLDAHGLDMLLQLVQVELAHQLAAQEHVVVTAADIQQERQRTLAKLFADADPSDYEGLLQQFLGREHLNPAQFELAVETTATLRQVVIPKLPQISETALREAFGAMYGATVEVRHIQCANLQEIQEAQRRLAAGDTFAKVAQEMSRNTSSAALGGKLAPFSRQTQGIPQAFRDTAFSLKVGEVSDPVQAGDTYHLIKLEKIIAPKAVKFEDHKVAVENELRERMIDAGIRQLRADNAVRALQVTKVEYPLLAEQWKEKLAEYDKQVRSQDEVARKMEEDRRPTSQPAEDSLIPGGSLIKQGTPRPGDATRPSTQPTTKPVGQGTTGSTTAPAPNPAVKPVAPTTPATVPAMPATRPASPQTPVAPATMPATQIPSSRAAEVARPPATMPAGSDSLSK